MFTCYEFLICKVVDHDARKREDKAAKLYARSVIQDIEHVQEKIRQDSELYD